MKTFITQHCVRWGDTDPTADLLYPSLFAIFDDCTWRMFRSVGILPTDMVEKFSIFGTPMVDTSMHVDNMPQWQDHFDVESQIESFGRSSFKVVHRVLVDQKTVVEGREVRVWAAKSDKGDGGLKTVEIPIEVKELFY